MPQKTIYLFSITITLLLFNACVQTPKSDASKEKQILGDRFRIREYYKEETKEYSTQIIKVKEVSVDDTVKWIREYINDSISLEYYRVGENLEGTATFYKHDKIVARKIYWEGEEWRKEEYHWSNDRLDSIILCSLDSTIGNQSHFSVYGKKVFNENGRIDPAKSKYCSYYPTIPLFITNEYNPFVFTFYSPYDEHCVLFVYDEKPYFATERNKTVIMMRPPSEGLYQYCGEVGFCNIIPEDTNRLACGFAAFYVPIYVIDRKDLYKEQ